MSIQGAGSPYELASRARGLRPKLILYGHSSHPRECNYATFRRIADEVGALTMAGVSHVGGRIAGGAGQATQAPNRSASRL
jgi:glycine hydroxymethyltransferase